jgi:RecJ-like exonuclease
MTRILIEPGYTVESRFIELDEHEELCEACRGTGETTWLYSQMGNVRGHCFECRGDGKRLRCTNCGVLQPHMKLRHIGQPWMDDLCLDCIRADQRFPTDTEGGAPHHADDRPAAQG